MDIEYKDQINSRQLFFKIKKRSEERFQNTTSKIYFICYTFDFASLTTIVRPLNSELFKAVIALLASELFSISTKPNPLDRPVARSFTTLAETTVPYGSNVACRVLSSIAHGRLPTKSLVLTKVPLKKLKNIGQLVRM